MSSDLGMDKREATESFIQWWKGIGFALQSIAVVEAWKEIGLQEGGSGQPCPRVLGNTAYITI